MLTLTLNKNRFKTLDFESFQAVFNLMLAHRHKLFDDEYFKGKTPYIERVYEIIQEHVPYFWLFLDEKTLKTQGFCYLYDIVPYKNRILSAFATVCFDKKVWGKRAQVAAKKLLIKLFSEYQVYKIKAECYENNILIPKFLTTLGFYKEATLENETIVENTLKNIDIWSIFNPKFRQNPEFYKFL